MSKLETANTTIIRPEQNIDLGRRQMFRAAGVTTLSAAAIAILGGCKSTMATTMASEGDVNTLNVALGLEHEAINAYQLGAESGLLQKDEKPDLQKNIVVRLVRKWLPMTPDYVEGRFFVVENGKRLITPLFLVLVTIEFTDLVFALDSIPAIFAVTPDPFIVYSSNVFALLGLRSLFFALSGVMALFSRLKTGLALILAFVGVKMILADTFKIPIGVSLGVIAGILGLSIAASLLWPVAERPKETLEPGKEAG